MTVITCLPVSSNVTQGRYNATWSCTKAVAEHYRCQISTTDNGGSCVQVPRQHHWQKRACPRGTIEQWVLWLNQTYFTHLLVNRNRRCDVSSSNGWCRLRRYWHHLFHVVSLWNHRQCRQFHLTVLVAANRRRTTTSRRTGVWNSGIAMVLQYCSIA